MLKCFANKLKKLIAAKKMKAAGEKKEERRNDDDNDGFEGFDGSVKNKFVYKLLTSEVRYHSLYAAEELRYGERQSFKTIRRMGYVASLFKQMGSSMRLWCDNKKTSESKDQPRKV